MLATVIAVGAMVFSAPARSQVLEISAEGEASVRAGGNTSGVMEISSGGTVSVRETSGLVSWSVLDESKSAFHEAAITHIPGGALTTAARARAPERFAAHVERAAAAASISPALLSAVVWQESRWNSQAVSPKGAIGLTQLMPATARELGVDPRDPIANLYGGARYLRKMLDAFGGDVERALAAYNAGASRVRRANGIPAIAETRSYVKSIVDRLSAISSGESQ